VRGELRALRLGGAAAGGGARARAGGGRRWAGRRARAAAAALLPAARPRARQGGQWARTSPRPADPHPPPPPPACPPAGLRYAEARGLPVSGSETLFSTPEDLRELEALLRAHPYPACRAYIRKGHGFFILGPSVAGARATFEALVAPFLLGGGAAQ
jgi:hypothetical protein